MFFSTLPDLLRSTIFTATASEVSRLTANFTLYIRKTDEYYQAYKCIIIISTDWLAVTIQDVKPL